MDSMTLALADDPEVPSALPLLEEIRRRMGARTDRHDEWSILETLLGTTAEELDFLARRLDLRALLGDMDDRWIGPRNRTALLELLTADRLEHLGTRARAAVVAALQRGRTGAAAERSIRLVLVGTREREAEPLGVDEPVPVLQSDRLHRTILPSAPTAVGPGTMVG